MTISSGYFNSIAGDRKYNAETMSKYFSGIISRGVLQNYLESFQVVANDSMTITVKTGKAYFSDGKWIESDASINLTLDTSDVTLKRIDRIVLRKDKSNSIRYCDVIVKKGQPSSNPTPPTLENTDSVEEISLCAVLVNNLATTITQVNITDERPNNDVCGFVHGLIDQIDTTTLFAAYDAAFNIWFGNVKDTLSTTTLIRKYNSQYVTVLEDETEIPIRISQYNFALDILNVYINGLKLIRGIDYTQLENDSTKITLTKGLDVNQLVEFEVFKSIDGSNAETVVQQVYELQTAVNTMEKYIYRTTGENDNIKLTAMVQTLLAEMGDLGQVKIEVIGNNFAVSNPVSGEGTASSRYKWFDFSYDSTQDKRVLVDFGNCNCVTIQTSLDNDLIFHGSSITIKNLVMDIAGGTNITVVESKNSKFINCNIKLACFGTACFAKGYGEFENNKITVISEDGAAYCFEGNGVGYQRITGGIYYAYTGSQTHVSAVAYTPASQPNGVLLMNNCNCPVVTKGNYKQSNTIKINSGHYALFGNILGASSVIASGATGVKQGEIVLNMV